MQQSDSPKGRLVLVLSFACFAALGIAAGMLGVAWPSIRGTFGLPIDALVALLISTTVGFAVGSVTVGAIMSHFGIGRFLLFANLLAAFGFVGYMIAPSWWWIVTFGLLTGWAFGAIDTGLNIYIAATDTVRTMNWMHAMFGVGATLGPLVMTAAIATGVGWRAGYLVAALVHLALGLLFTLVLKQMDFRGMAHIGSTPADRPENPMITLRLPIVILSILLFLLYTGVESTTGQWSYSLFTEERGMSPFLAGIMTSLFWGMLTLGRILFGAIADRVGIQRLLRLSMTGVVFSATLFLARSPVAGFAAVGLMGLSLSAIFPTLTSDTPYRVGTRHAASAIGFQTGAASVGLAILPGTAGFLAARLGLEVLGPYLVVTSLMMLVTNEVAVRIVQRRRMGSDLIEVPSRSS